MAALGCDWHSLSKDMSRHPESKSAAERRPKVSDRPERRGSLRGDGQGEPSRDRLISLILGTYAEMPGLSLHLHQAARLFGLRELTCSAVLNDLVRDARLRRSADSQYRGVN